MRGIYLANVLLVRGSTEYVIDSHIKDSQMTRNDNFISSSYDPSFAYNHLEIILILFSA